MSPIRHPIPEDFEEPRPRKKKAKCRVCGCTDDHACEGGCYWVEKDLCSTCYEASVEIVVMTAIKVGHAIEAEHRFMLPCGVFDKDKPEDLAKIILSMLKVELPKFMRDLRTLKVMDGIRKKLWGKDPMRRTG